MITKKFKIKKRILKHSGIWGGHHKLHNLSEADFPGFEYTYMNIDGVLSETADETIRNVVDGVEKTEGLILMKWTK